MNKYQTGNDDQAGADTEQKRRRRELYLILGIIPLIILLTYIESNISIIGDVPVATNVLVIGLININIILLILLVFLVLRNAVKLFLENRRGVMGSRLRTKLIAAFLGLTIVPTFVLFFFVVGFINKSIDAWFDIKIEDSLKESLELAQTYYKQNSERALVTANSLAEEIRSGSLELTDEALFGMVDKRRLDYGFARIAVVNADGARSVNSSSDEITDGMMPALSEERLSAALLGEAVSYVDSMPTGDVVTAVSPLYSPDARLIEGVVVVNYYVPIGMLDKMKEISTAFEQYRQLQLLKNPVKATYFMILLIITLLIVFFSFWIGRYIAKEITVPINELAEGTLAVAGGDLDVKIDAKGKDEIGLLVKSFNRMTQDLKSGKSEVERANIELRRKNIEVEERGRYIEIVLANVPAGVVSIDKEGHIISINMMAADMLETQEREALGKSYDEVFVGEGADELSDMVHELRDKEMETLERQIKLASGDRQMTVLVNFNALNDEEGNYIGIVAVMDDLSHLLKTQRMFAWKEVARRIAHEIKNPLTPIQLSAQRLRKKYMDSFPGDDKIFDDCTKTIVRQVEELKGLVNEFSSFARLPTANPTPNDLNDIVGELLPLYQTGHKEVSLSVETDENLPVFNLDREQIKRVLINLLDNSIASFNGDGGEIMVKTHFDVEKDLASLTVMDDGCGIPSDDKERLFEPYFSTKKSGTGLGLAIVSNIVSDHNGYIRVRDNIPKGTSFTIELPIKAVPI